MPTIDKVTEKLKESRIKKPDMMLKRKAVEVEEEKSQVGRVKFADEYFKY